MNKNTNTKTKKNVTQLVWPTGHFTITDLESKYTNMVPITLRFRVKKAQENKELVVIGKMKPAIGRPKMVYSVANPTKEVLDNAKAAGVLPLDEAKTTIAVADVKTEKKVATKVVVPTTAQSTAPAAVTSTEAVVS
jgi:hypothetical protein